MKPATQERLDHTTKSPALNEPGNSVGPPMFDVPGFKKFGQGAATLPRSSPRKLRGPNTFPGRLSGIGPHALNKKRFISIARGPLTTY